MPTNSSSPQPQFQPAYSKLTNGLSAPAGYAAPANVQCDRKPQTTAVAEQVLRDPLLLLQVTERVYELLLEDLYRQKERDRNYGGFF